MSPSVALASHDPSNESADALVVCVLAGTLPEHPTGRALERALGGSLLAHAKAVEFEGKAEQVLDLATLGRLKAPRLLLVGAGPSEDLGPARVRSVVATALRAVQNAKTVALVL